MPEALANLSGIAEVEAILRGAPASSTAPDVVSRFAQAMSGTGKPRGALERALLLRQALRHCDAGAATPSLVTVPHGCDLPFAEAGLDATPNEEGDILISAPPWRPDWLDARAPEGVDGFACAAQPCRQDKPVAADPFMTTRLGHEHYKSAGQRAAVRAALSTPPGGTTIIALPTGEGKSTIFQAIGLLGFAGEPPPTRGVLVVIVPTVALGINHEHDAVRRLELTRPLVYRGGGSPEMTALRDKIAAGEQSVCFVSPEAACKSLRSALTGLARQGLLRALVIDEAHLVDQWGGDFRSEFQELSGLRHSLLHEAGDPEREPRTILLSATLTDGSLETLSALFGRTELEQVVSVTRTRAEPDYWVAPFAQTEDERIARVGEALRHLPRPAILYVTKVEDAEDWYHRLTKQGFRCLARLHGKTGEDERDRIVTEWRDGHLDLVIGTSAFGLGIDYAHVRSVIHACIPETLDRFYQEVGRGGRDGCASVSLIVPAPSDIPLAKRLNEQRTIGAERGLTRWSAMFAAKSAYTDGVFDVCLDIPPSTTEADIDMKGKRNQEWNRRTLTLLARADAVRLLGDLPRRQEEEESEDAWRLWTKVETLRDDHLDPAFWQGDLRRFRDNSRAAHARNLDFMHQFLRNTGCAAELFVALYGTAETAHTCSRCHLCRSELGCRKVQRMRDCRIPWPAPLIADFDRLVDPKQGAALVRYGADDLKGRQPNRFAEALETLCNRGLTAITLIEPPPVLAERVRAVANKRALFVSEHALDEVFAGGLFERPGLSIFGPMEVLPQHKLIPPVAGLPRLVLIEESQKDETGRDLALMANLRTHRLAPLLDKVRL